ncbi:MAG TPA: hypothetical protein VMY80_10195 [Anaerolineae bacterium]|nr:hypothetical protein [Anaerolineae bacterium]
MSERLYSILTRCIIAGMFIGILGMIQPLTVLLFKAGFLILFYSTLAYIVLSHVTPRRQESPTDVERSEV